MLLLEKEDVGGVLVFCSEVFEEAVEGLFVFGLFGEISDVTGFPEVLI